MTNTFNSGEAEQSDNGHTAPVATAQLEPPVEVSLREAMAQFATGVTVVTAPGDQCHGMTANAVSSVSLDPPLVLCCVNRTARMHAAIVAGGVFGVSVLGAGQEHLARYFADRRRPAGQAQFDAVGWQPGTRTGAPLLSGSLAWLECELTDAHAGGDHSIFLGHVVSTHRGPGRRALVFYGGAFHQVSCR